MDVRTRTRIFGVLVLVGRPVSTRELVALCQPLGLSATNVKSHLTRLSAEGAVIRTGLRRSHRYAISPQRQKVVQAISSRLERRAAEPWDGEWLMAALKAQAPRSQRQRLRSDLWFDGFRPCGPDTYLRPAWPRAWARGRAQELANVASACIIGQLVGTVHLGQVRKLYRLPVMDAQARRLARRINAAADRTKDPEEAFKARLTIGGEVAQFVSHVPQLPMEVWNGLTGVRDLQAAYSRFDARIVVHANSFVQEILFDRRRLAPRTLPPGRSRARSTPRRIHGRPDTDAATAGQSGPTPLRVKP